MSPLVMPSRELLAKCKDRIIMSPPLVPRVLDDSKIVTRRMSRKWEKLKVGDFVAVCENWQLHDWGKNRCTILYPAGEPFSGGWCWRHDNPPKDWLKREAARAMSFVAKQPTNTDRNPKDARPLRPSLLLPLWACRIVLRITEPPRVERAQDITEEEAKREGVKPFPYDPEGDCWTDGKYRTAFEYTWGELHGWAGPESFNENPEVVRIAFERVKGADG